MGHVAGRRRGKKLRARQGREREAELRCPPWDDTITWSDYWGRKYVQAARDR